MFVRKSLRQAVFILLVSALALTACNLGSTPAPTVDVNAINTAAVQTAMGQLSSQFTQTAQAAPPVSSLPTNTAQALPTFQLPTANGTVVAPTSGALPTVSFNNTPLPGFTPLASPIAPTSSGTGGGTASGCNDGAFIGESLPDKSEIDAGDKFTKSWEIQNTGTCTWEIGYVFAFLPNDSTSGLTGYDIVIKTDDETTKPGHSQSFVVKLTAPTNPGEYFGYWKLKDKDGKSFGPRVYLDIIVK